MKKQLIVCLAPTALPFAGCANTAPQPDAQPPAASTPDCITEEEVVNAQKAWGDGIVKIGKTKTDGGDVAAAASEHINRFYAYDQSLVLFKPTLASDEQFRGTFDGALSYFVGGNPSFPEDKGFALKPWTQVRWANAGIANNCTMAVAMGNYFFTAAGGDDETKVEYTIAYIKDTEGNLRMIAHKSALPYTPEAPPAEAAPEDTTEEMTTSP